MTSRTLLEYLTERNPELNSDSASQGLPTSMAAISDIKRIDWDDFTLDTLLACYGDILRKPISSLPNCSPDLTNLEREIWTEDTFEHLMTRSIVPHVSVGLAKAQSEMNISNAIDMTRGGRASTRQLPPSGGAGGEGNLLFPDWAGAVKTADETGYDNRCPGETKLAEKWKSTMGRDYVAYDWPITQLLKYCCTQWRTRYGYIINQEEVVVMRFSREKVGSGIALKRSPREPALQQGLSPRSHQRNDSHTSASSQMQIDARSPQHSRQSSQQGHSHSQSHQRNISLASSFSQISIDNRSSDQRSQQSSLSSGTGAEDHPMTSSYCDDEQGIEIQPVEFKRIPWSNSGPKKLTVKLALWWIHMLSGAGCDVDIGHDYPPLHSWTPVDGGYKHTSTGSIVEAKPTTGEILQNQSPQRPSTPQNRDGSISSLSTPRPSPPPERSPSGGSYLSMEDIADLKFDESKDMFMYLAKVVKEWRYINRGTRVWSFKNRKLYILDVINGEIKCHEIKYPNETRPDSSSNGSDRESYHSDQKGKQKQ
ncbi:hypothetical protein EMPG_09372 [Blastomyces silverae]|uniref:Uncharacterized protein n=1 Tax=Blastomyces silverae TaxID=2060906 RepID=A0A0H1BS91_9EURO|nr:hypothetical protein EMPG_09372 [Blastomyces silverae]